MFFFIKAVCLLYNIIVNYVKMLNTYISQKYSKSAKQEQTYKSAEEKDNVGYVNRENEEIESDADGMTKKIKYTDIKYSKELWSLSNFRKITKLLSPKSVRSKLLRGKPIECNVTKCNEKVSDHTMPNLFTTHMELFCDELNMIESVEWIFIMRNGKPTLDYTATYNSKNMCQDYSRWQECNEQGGENQGLFKPGEEGRRIADNSGLFNSLLIQNGWFMPKIINNDPEFLVNCKDKLLIRLTNDKTRLVIFLDMFGYKQEEVMVTTMMGTILVMGTTERKLIRNYSLPPGELIKDVKVTMSEDLVLDICLTKLYQPQ